MKRRGLIKKDRLIIFVGLGSAYLMKENKGSTLDDYNKLLFNMFYREDTPDVLPQRGYTKRK